MNVLDGLHPFLAFFGAGGLKVQTPELALGCRRELSVKGMSFLGG
jgi:hypothetical protein